jgi:glycine amidinotransferase
VLINPERVERLPEMFKQWEVLPAPPPSMLNADSLYMSSAWISMNILMLDEQRVVVEAREEPLTGLLRANGFTPIQCHFTNFNKLGGSFHCATLDVRRRGVLQSYF